MTQRQRWWDALLVIGLLATACKREAAQGGGPLPPVEAGQPAKDAIQNPFTEIEPGVFSRVVYRSTASPTQSIEVRDIELARGKAAKALVFPGAAVVEVRGGKGSLSARAKAQEIQAGHVLGISQGDTLQVANRDSVALSLRVYVIGAR
jgi:hypothetical protein